MKEYVSPLITSLPDTCIVRLTRAGTPPQALTAGKEAALKKEGIRGNKRYAPYGLELPVVSDGCCR